MAQVELVNNIMSQYGLDTSATTTDNSMDKDAFLNLLVTQMQYQDPLEPTNNQEFLAQMAQFSSLEQMQNLNTSFAMQQGYDLIGKTVIGLEVNAQSLESNYITGTVDTVSLKNGEVYIQVDGTEIPVSNVEAVVNDTTDYQELTAAIEAINLSLATVNEKLEAIKVASEKSTATTDETINND